MLSIESASKDKMIAVNCFLISFLVPKLQGSEIVKIRGINGKKLGKNQSELIKICDVIYCLQAN